MSSELNPRPFCGKQPKMNSTPDGELTVRCWNCRVTMRGHIKKNVIANWNHRATPPLDLDTSRSMNRRRFLAGF